MNPETNQSPNYKLIGIIALLVIIALFAGVMLGRANTNNQSTQTTTSDTAPATTSVATGDVKSLVSYNLPDGWKEGSCPAAAGVVYIIPNGESLDCSANPGAPIKLYIDAQNTTDCQQLNNVGNVKKHVCISLFIDGHKSLKASTEYPKSSAYSTDTTVSDYYIDTGKGVVKVEYTYTSSNDFQTAFDQFANSINVK